jgi:two-component system sensor histidine kinase/response regulator
VSRTGRDTRPARHLRVLVADDNAVNQMVARMMLERLGCRVDIAADGQEAVEMVELVQYGVIFMDCEMPVLDGFGATAEIRRRQSTGRRVPIVAMTARALQGEHTRCLQGGMDDYLSKPVRVECLEAVLNRWDTPPMMPEEHLTIPPKAHDCASTTGGKTAAADRQPALNPLILAGLKSLALDTDPTFLEQIEAFFLADGRSGLTALRLAADGDVEGLRQAAHGLNGMTATVGAEAMRALCQELETLGTSGSVAGARELIDQLEDEFHRVESELDAVVHQGAYT